MSNRYITQRQYGEWAIIDTAPGVNVTIAVGCPIGQGGTTAGRIYAERIRHTLNIASELEAAARALLDKIDSITTEDFARGAERAEREALRALLAGEAR